MLTDEDIERAWLGDQTVAPRGGRITGFSRLASFARAIEAITREQTIEECAKVCADIAKESLPSNWPRVYGATVCKDAIRALGSKT